MAELSGVLAVVAAYAHDLCRLHWRKQRRFGERDPIHAAAGKAFHVAIATLRRLRKKTGDFVLARDGLDQAVVGGIVEFESAVFHVRNIQTQRAPFPHKHSYTT